jgi:hypothetical protein
MQVQRGLARAQQPGRALQRAQHPGQQLQQGGLAHAVGAAQPGDAGLQRGGAALQHHPVGPGEGQLVELQGDVVCGHLGDSLRVSVARASPTSSSKRPPLVRAAGSGEAGRSATTGRAASRGSRPPARRGASWPGAGGRPAAPQQHGRARGGGPQQLQAAPAFQGLTGQGQLAGGPVQQRLQMGLAEPAQAGQAQQGQQGEGAQGPGGGLAPQGHGTGAQGQAHGLHQTGPGQRARRAAPQRLPQQGLLPAQRAAGRGHRHRPGRRAGPASPGRAAPAGQRGGGRQHGGELGQTQAAQPQSAAGAVQPGGLLGQQQGAARRLGQGPGQLGQGHQRGIGAPAGGGGMGRAWSWVRQAGDHSQGKKARACRAPSAVCSSSPPSQGPGGRRCSSGPGARR